MEPQDSELKLVGHDTLEARVTSSTDQEHSWRIVVRRAVDRLGQPWCFELIGDQGTPPISAAAARQGYASPELAKQAAMLYIALQGEELANEESR